MWSGMSSSSTMSGLWTFDSWLSGIIMLYDLIPSCVCACVCVPWCNAPLSYSSFSTILFIFYLVFQVLEKRLDSPFHPALIWTSVHEGTRKLQQGGQTKPVVWRVQSRSRREGRTLGRPVMHFQQTIHTERKQPGTKDSSQDRQGGQGRAWPCEVICS